MPQGYNSSALDPLPLDRPDINVEPRPAQPQSEQVPPGAGFVDKKGATAYVATQLLNGWMAGRKMRQERELKKAVGDVQSSKSVYDTLAQSYQEMIRSGANETDPQVQKAKTDVAYAWNNYLNTAHKYATDGDKDSGGQKPKKSAGQKVKSAAGNFFGMNVNPELFRDSAINVLRQSGPPALNTKMSPQDRAANAQANEIEKDAQVNDRWRTLAGKDKRTPEEDKELERLEAIKFPKDKFTKTRDSLLDDVMGGKTQTWTGAQRELAENLGLIHKGQNSTNIWKDQKGNDWVLVMDENGKEVGRRSLGKGYMAPDQATVAQRIFDNQIKGLVKLYKEGKSWDHSPTETEQKELDAEAHRFALMSVSGYKGNPIDTERQQSAISSAIQQVIGEARSAKDGREQVYQNFIVGKADNPDGLYMYRSQLVDPQEKPGFWGQFLGRSDKYYGGASKGELPGAEAEFRNRVFVSLKHKFPKKTDDEIRAMMPAPIFPGGGENKSGLSPTPESSSKLSATPEGDTQGAPRPVRVRVGGQWYSRAMTKDQIAAAKEHDPNLEIIDDTLRPPLF